MHIADMQNKSWANSEAKGFHEEDKGVPAAYVVATKLMLIVSELSETLEEVRSGKPLTYYNEGSDKPEGLMPELADAVIRLGDLAEIVNGNLEDSVLEKMKYNSTRPHKHGGKII